MDAISDESVESSLSNSQGQSPHKQDSVSVELNMDIQTSAADAAGSPIMQHEPNRPNETSPLNPAVTTAGTMPLLLRLPIKTVKSLILFFFPSWIFSKFLVQATIPALADNLVPLFFIGNIPNESALALAGQFTFISIIVEVIQEGIVNSLFFYVGRNYAVNRMKALQAFKISLTILVALGSVLSVCMLLLTPQFVRLIDTPPSIAEATRHFLYTSSFSFPIVLVNAALSTYLLITTHSLLIFAQLSNVVLSFLCNFFMFGRQEISLHWELDQLGYAKIIQAGVLCLNNFVFCLIVERIGPLEFLTKVPFTNELRTNFKDLFHVSWGNFGDSTVRNFFYFVVTLKFLNNLGEDEVAAWNLLNSIVWGLLLIPSFTVANYAKVRIGHRGTKGVIREVALESFKSLICWLLVVSIVTSLIWPEMSEFFGKSNLDAQTLSREMLEHVGWIFIVFSFNNAMDSLFLGVGKTEYVFYQSLVTNMVVYFVPWVLYLANVITPSYWLVVGLYIGGMLVDFGLTLYFCIRVWDGIPDY